MSKAGELQPFQRSGEPGDATERSNPTARRAMLKKAGMFLGAAGALAALGTPADANNQGQGLGPDEIAGLWASLVSAADNSFPPFEAFELYGSGLWIGSGQTDLTPSALASSLWAVYRRVAP